VVKECIHIVEDTEPGTYMVKAICGEVFHHYTLCVSLGALIKTHNMKD